MFYFHSSLLGLVLSIVSVSIFRAVLFLFSSTESPIKTPHSLPGDGDGVLFISSPEQSLIIAQHSLPRDAIPIYLISPLNIFFFTHFSTFPRLTTQCTSTDHSFYRSDVHLTEFRSSFSILVFPSDSHVIISRMLFVSFPARRTLSSSKHHSLPSNVIPFLVSQFLLLFHVSQ